MTETAYGMIAGFLIFLAGMALGASFVYFGMKKGIQLMDNLAQDKAPFDDDFVEDENNIQTRTDGTMLSDETEG